MFGRGTWAILGLGKDSLDSFKTDLGDRPLMAAASQMAASAIARTLGSDALGINPFSAPRLDEDHSIEVEHQAELAGYATTDREERAEYTLPAEILECEGYACGVERFRIHPEMPWFGLWAVSNDWRKVSDVASIKEQRSYVLLERPYRFLQATDRKSVDEVTAGALRVVRTQVPVLLDFNEGRVYVESGNKKLINRVIVGLRQLGLEILPVAWKYDTPDWIGEILNRLVEQSQYRDDFMKRAEEAKRFSPKEIETLENRELESIVAGYFSMTELPSEVWVGVSTPAQIRLHPASPAIAAKAPTTATTLLHMTDGAGVLSGTLTFQDRMMAAAGPDREERAFRKDLFRIQLNDRINLTDVGAAMLRGFDMPDYRKNVRREIRETRQVPSLEQFWSNWLLELGNSVRTTESAFREILDLGGSEPAGVLPMQFPAKEELAELANA